jgi:hypothetical protein
MNSSYQMTASRTYTQEMLTFRRCGSSHVNELHISNYLFQYVRGQSAHWGTAQAGTKGKTPETALSAVGSAARTTGRSRYSRGTAQQALAADTFVDFDHSLNAAVRRLRDALGESAEAPVFVETRRSTRISLHCNIEIPAATPSTRPRPWQWLSTTRNAVFGGLTACALALSFLYYSGSIRSQAGPPAVTPAVTNVGRKVYPEPFARRPAFGLRLEWWIWSSLQLVCESRRHGGIATTDQPRVARV